MCKPDAYLIEWFDPDEAVHECRRLQFDDEVDSWMVDPKVTPLYRRADQPNADL